MFDIDSLPTHRMWSASSDRMRLAAVVMASMPLAQLRCTLLAMSDSGRPALRAMTRATLAASMGWATLPAMSSSRAVAGKAVRAISSRAATAPRSSAENPASAPPALENGVRTPSMMARRSFMASSFAFLVLPGRSRDGGGGLLVHLLDQVVVNAGHHVAFDLHRRGQLLADREGLGHEAPGMDLLPAVEVGVHLVQERLDLGLHLGAVEEGLVRQRGQLEAFLGAVQGIGLGEQQGGGEGTALRHHHCLVHQRASTQRVL